MKVQEQPSASTFSAMRDTLNAGTNRLKTSSSGCWNWLIRAGDCVRHLLRLVPDAISQPLEEPSAPADSANGFTGASPPGSDNEALGCASFFMLCSVRCASIFLFI